MTIATIHAELPVLAAAAMHPRVFERLTVDLGITTTHFASPLCATTWRELGGVYDRTGTTDHAALATALQPHMTQAGQNAQEWVAEIQANEPAVGAITEHANHLIHLGLRRAWKQAGYLLVEAADTDNESLVAQAEEQLAAPTVTDDTHHPDRVAGDLADYLDDNQPVGHPTGFPTLDRFLGGGLRPGDLTALGAWTGLGKSCLVDQILTLNARTGRKVHAYINEMSPRDRALRMVARDSNVPYSKLVVRELDAGQKAAVLQAAKRIPFGLTDCSQWAAEQIARHIRVNRWDLCCLDILHNMDYRDEKELRRIVATLAAAARSSSTHLIMVVHLKEARATSDMLPRPVVNDIRDSGMIKNLCASVLLLHRAQQQQGGVVFTTNDASIIAGKARHGQQGATIPATFNPDRMRFDPVAPVRAAA